MGKLIPCIQPCILHNEHSSVPLPGSPSPPNVTLYQIVFEKMRVSEDQCSPALTHVHHMHCSRASHALLSGITGTGHGHHTCWLRISHMLAMGITQTAHGHYTRYSRASHALTMGITRTTHRHHTCWPLASHVLLTGITHAGHGITYTGHGPHMCWPRASHALVTGITCTSHGHLSLPPSCSLHVTSVLSPILILSLYSTDTLYPSSLSLVLSAFLLYEEIEKRWLSQGT